MSHPSLQTTDCLIRVERPEGGVGERRGPRQGSPVVPRPVERSYTWDRGRPRVRVSGDAAGAGRVATAEKLKDLV